jgi:hypothetical protein
MPNLPTQTIWPPTAETVDGHKSSEVLELSPDASTRKHWGLSTNPKLARSLAAVKQVPLQPRRAKWTIHSQPRRVTAGYVASALGTGAASSWYTPSGPNVSGFS